MATGRAGLKTAQPSILAGCVLFYSNKALINRCLRCGGAAALVGKALFKQIVHGIGTGQAGLGCCFKQALTDRYANALLPPCISAPVIIILRQWD